MVWWTDGGRRDVDLESAGAIDSPQNVTRETKRKCDPLQYMQSNSPLGLPGAPGGTSGHCPNEKSWNIENLGAILVPKMGFLRSETNAIGFQFGSDGLKIKQF